MDERNVQYMGIIEFIVKVKAMVSKKQLFKIELVIERKVNIMLYKNIPGTRLSPSAICLGTAKFGTGIGEKESFEMLDAYVDMGGNFIDTAHVYANWIPGEKSLSEKMIGKWMKSRGNREKLIVGTKGAHPELSCMHIPRLSREEIAKDLDESLEYLQVDYIDLYWLHRDDPSRPVSEILETLNDHVKAGKIKYFGCSNWHPKRILQAMDYAEKNGMKSFAANQMMWSLAVPNIDNIGDKTLVAMDEETMNLHKTTGMAAIAYSSQANGFFSKMASGGAESLKKNVKNMYYNETNLRRLENVKKLAFELKATVTEIALSYLISQPFPVIPIIGCRSIRQLRESMKARELLLSREMLEFLEG